MFNYAAHIPTAVPCAAHRDNPRRDERYPLNAESHSFVYFDVADVCAQRMQVNIFQSRSGKTVLDPQFCRFSKYA